MLYPLKFHPILKSTIWGGNKIIPFKNLGSQQQNVGESWEVSNVPGDVSIVANGPLAGKSLSQLVEEYKEEFVGKNNYERYGNNFPLLVKFIDAADDLSIQVHPDDTLAMKRHSSLGKTEMWYVVDNNNNTARLRSGLKRSITPAQYEAMVADNTICDALAEYEVNRGDVFYLPAGRVHSIGAGCFIAEIQETSNVTYRIFDFNRTDANGQQRELHTELSKEAIDYTVESDYRTLYDTNPNRPVKLVDCEHFNTSLLELYDDLIIDYGDTDSFVIYICTEGKATISDFNGTEVELTQGHCVLLPASMQEIKITVHGSVKILETYVP